MPPPVTIAQKCLALDSPNFSWEAFEEFCCDFLAAGPELKDKAGQACRVISISLYGRRGDAQKGIDIRATMSSGEEWAFQCKHVKDWDATQTQRAVEKFTYRAARKFLLISCQAKPAVRDAIRNHPDWELWDVDDISREFRRLATPDAARLLFAHFGPGWAEAMLGFPGRSPFITPQQFFAPWLNQERSYHHCLPLIGREDVLGKLDEFVQSKLHRVFFLVGRGGLGKSRLLLEWGRTFPTTHEGWTLRFVSGSPSDLGPALDASRKPLVLVFDDAHRFDEVRRALFGELPRREDVKLVLLLRPGPTGQIVLELTDAGYDLKQLRDAVVLKRLNAAQALELVEQALGPAHADRYRIRLRDLSRDCPLLAVLAAELIKRGELDERHLEDSREFQTLVFAGLLRDANPVEARFGAVPVQELLRLIALLSPIKSNSDFLQKVAVFLGGNIKPHTVQAIIDALDEVGLLVAPGAGIQITPDLLSDHLAYTACYSKSGTNSTFAERVLNHFSPEDFPRLMLHLAEAEWRAISANENAESIVEPLWQWFALRFEASPFWARWRQIDEWEAIAPYQPQRTLQLAHLGLRLTTAPLPDGPLQGLMGSYTHLDVLAHLPALLRSVAVYHPEHVAASLDLLWQIGCNRDVGSFAGRAHPVKMIGEIATIQRWKDLSVQRELLTWVEKLIATDDWLTCGHKPGWILEEVLAPFFATAVDDNWRTGRTVHLRQRPVPIANTAPLRDRIMALCRTIIARQSTKLTLAAIEVLERSIDLARIGFGETSARFQEEWLPERRKGLAVLDEILRDSQVPILHFRVRQVLRHYLQFDQTEFQNNCREVFERIPNTLDIRVLRAALGNHGDEFERPEKSDSTDGFEAAKRRWTQFVSSTAVEMLAAWPRPGDFLDRLGQWEAELMPLDFQPNFGPLLQAVANAQPHLALELARSLITRSAHAHSTHLDALVLAPTKTDPFERLNLCEQALETGVDELMVGAIQCFTWWRREGPLPPRARELLADAGHRASARVAQALINFVWMNDAEPLPSDWELLANISIPPEAPGLGWRFIARAASLLKKPPLPSPEIVERILSKVERYPSIEGHDMEHGLEEFAKHYSNKVFLLFWNRHELRKTEGLELGRLPFDFDEIEFTDVMADPQAAAVVRELEHRFLSDRPYNSDENRILQIAILQCRQTAEANLLRLVEKASTAEHLEHLVELVRNWNAWSVVLASPDFARAILVKAHHFGDEVFKSVSDRLHLLPGSRGSSDGAPDPTWKALLSAAESMAHRYAGDPLLGPLYTAAASHERAWIEQSRQRVSIDDEMVDD